MLPTWIENSLLLVWSTSIKHRSGSLHSAVIVSVYRHPQLLLTMLTAPHAHTSAARALQMVEIAVLQGWRNCLKSSCPVFLSTGCTGTAALSLVKEFLGLITGSCPQGNFCPPKKHAAFLKQKWFCTWHESCLRLCPFFLLPKKQERLMAWIYGAVEKALSVSLGSCKSKLHSLLISIGGYVTTSGFHRLGLCIGMSLVKCDFNDLSGPWFLHHSINRILFVSGTCDVLCVSAYMRF